MREHGAERVVVGMPLTLRGERGAQALETEAFVTRCEAVDVPVETYDERFTTALAARGGGDLRRGRARRRAPPRELPAS